MNSLTLGMVIFQFTEYIGMDSRLVRNHLLCTLTVSKKVSMVQSQNKQLPSPLIYSYLELTLD